MPPTPATYRSQPGTSYRACLYDIFAAIRQWNLWFSLGWSNIRVQYQRALIGRFWLSFQILIWGASFIALFTRTDLAGQGINYPIYSTSGFLFWQVIIASLTGGSRIFSGNTTVMLNFPRPFTSFVITWLGNTCGKFMYQCLGLAVIMAFSPIEPSLNLLLLIPGLICFFIACTGIAFLMALLGLLIRDLPFAINASMRVLLFATPIFWVPGETGIKAVLAQVNPLAYLLHIARAPLVGLPITQMQILVAAGIAAGIWLAAIITFKQIRHKMIFWM